MKHMKQFEYILYRHQVNGTLFYNVFCLPGLNACIDFMWVNVSQVESNKETISIALPFTGIKDWQFLWHAQQKVKS